ncbi:MAG: LppX_LprAFG lipoprotein [Chloroflexi bacterium]|nr:LppX_LprAFG lipoprotein [Chloroflexota bacterium]
MRRLSMSVLLALLAVLAASCGVLSPATPTATARSVLEKASLRMSALQTAAFLLEHEQGTTPLMPGVGMRSVEGRVVLPSSFELEVSALAAFMSAAIKVKVVAQGDEAFMTDPISGAWQRVDPEALPFDFRDLGRTLGDIVMGIQEPAFGGEERIGGVQMRIITGWVATESLRRLVPGALEGEKVELQVWLEEEGLLRKARIQGKAVAGDTGESVRVLTLHSFDQPVQITLPG